MFHRIFFVLLIACTVTACGGGEDYDDPTETAMEAQDALPSRGPQWLVAPTQAQLLSETSS